MVQIKELLLAGPDSTQEESEVQMYLLALKNALLPDAVPLLTKYAESEVGAFSTIAITALQRYDTALITDEVNTSNHFHSSYFFYIVEKQLTHQNWNDTK